MMQIKVGAKVRGLRPEMVLAAVIAEHVYHERGLPLRITEATGGKHAPNSLHYVGLAIDCGTTGVVDVAALGAALREALGREYDVVEEIDHIHVEFQPETP
ncbi:MAG: hypothetical protein ACUVT2_08165 [Thiobacillaceae bacterium]